MEIYARIKPIIFVQETNAPQGNIFHTNRF
jgi:hypothetical protein